MNPLDLIDFKTPHSPRAYVNSVVHFHYLFTQEKCEKIAKKAGWNVFNFQQKWLLQTYFRIQGQQQFLFNYL